MQAVVPPPIPRGPLPRVVGHGRTNMNASHWGPHSFALAKSAGVQERGTENRPDFYFDWSTFARDLLFYF